MISGALLVPQRSVIRAAAIVALSIAVGCSHVIPRNHSSIAGLAFVGVDVLTMEHRELLQNQTVVIQGDRVTMIRANNGGRLPEDIRTVSGKGRVLMPGLVDAHIHLRHADSADLIDYLRTGITCAREMNGRPFLLEWRDRIDAGELVGPCLKVAAPTMGNFSSPKEGYPTPQSRAAAIEVVRRFGQQGYDWIKVYTFLPSDAFLGVIEQSKALGIPVGGHIPVEFGVLKSIAAGIHSNEHLTEYVGSSLTADSQELDAADFRSLFGAGDIDWHRMDEAIRATVESQTWNVPTLIWFDRILPAPMASDAWADSDLRRQGSANRREIVRRLFAAGAALAVGTDSDAGDDLPASVIHDELEAMLEAGLDAYDTIRLATVGGANLIGLSSEIGTVTIGKRADLLLLRCDPSQDIACLREPEMVVARGKVVVE